MNCTIQAQTKGRLPVKGVAKCSQPAHLAVAVPRLEHFEVRWFNQPFCKEHAAQMAILKYLYGAKPTPFTEEEIEFLVANGYNRQETAPAIV